MLADPDRRDPVADGAGEEPAVLVEVLRARLAAQQRCMMLLDEVDHVLGVHLDTERLVRALTSVLREHGLADEVIVWLLGGGSVLRPLGSDEAPSPAALDTRETGVPHHEHGRAHVPLAASGSTIGVLELRRTAPFDSDEVDVVRRIAARAASALRNAHEYERERNLAETLQRAMLPEPAQVPGASVAAVYQPPGDGHQVGGDWYDAFTTPRGTLMLTVGDVTGHGLDAAVLMGRLRHVLRAYATEGHGPAATLSLLHDLLRHERTSLYATAMLAELDPGTGVLRWANAGHPPPMLRRGADVRVVEPARRGHMLGAPMRAAIPEHTEDLHAADALLLYTDGLVERRARHIDDGIADLARSWSAAGPVATRTDAARLVAATLGSYRPPDDVCLLVCHWANVRR